MDSLSKILVVDDEPGIVDGMERHLKRHKFQVFKALNSDEALKIFDQENPGICILDVYLGVSSLNGVEILEKIKQKNDKAHCILLTVAMEDDAIIKRGKELGGIYLNKPLDYKQWLKVVNDLAGNKMNGDG